MEKEKEYQEVLGLVEQYMRAEIRWSVIKGVFRIFGLLLGLSLISAIVWYRIEYKPPIKHQLMVESARFKLIEKKGLSPITLKKPTASNKPKNPPAKKLTVATIKFKPEVAESFVVSQIGVISQNGFFFTKTETTLRVQLLEAHPHTSNFDSKRVSLKVVICNVGNQEIHIGPLYLWYTNSDEKWTIHWRSKLGFFRHGECQTYEMMSDELNEDAQLKPPLGLMYISLESFSLLRKIDLKEADQDGEIVYIWRAKEEDNGRRKKKDD